MINEQLYQLLRNVFGSNVRVRRAGIKMACEYYKDARTEKVKLKVRRHGQGEEYQLDCPLCGDHRARLFINHRWGVYDKKTKTRNLWMANCYNEACFHSYSRQKQLYDRVYGGIGIGMDELGDGEVNNRPLTVQEVQMPGAVWPLADMLKRSPNHHSLQYLRDRLIDPELVAEPYHLSYCLDTHIANAENRIIIPMEQGGKLVGWQARYIGEPETKEIKKYHTGSGTALTLIWYNADVALSYYTKVIVEGVTDAWAVGPQAMAIFNKKMGVDRMKMFVRLLRQWEEPGNFVLLLDPDQNPKDKAKGEEHHMKVVTELFEDKKHFGKGSVLPVYLPSGTDPGSLDRAYIWDVIRKVAEEHDFEVSDRRIKRQTKEVHEWSPKSNSARPARRRRTAQSTQ